MLKLGHFGKQIRNIWEVIKCDAGEGWRRSVGQIVWETNEVLQRVKEERNILHTTNSHLKHTVEGKIEGRIEVMGR